MRLDPSQCADLSRRPGREPALYTRNYYPDLLMSFYSMSSWTGSALIRVIILRLGSHQSAQRLENREISQPPLTPHTLYLSHTLRLCLEKPSHDADHFKHKGKWRMKAESDHDTNSGPFYLWQSQTQTASSLYTPNHPQLTFKSDYICKYCIGILSSTYIHRAYTLRPYIVPIWPQNHILLICRPLNNTKCTLRHCDAISLRKGGKKRSRKTTFNLASK